MLETFPRRPYSRRVKMFKRTIQTGRRSLSTLNRNSKSFRSGSRSSEELREKIQQKAYELFEQRGCEHGHDLEDWLEAERLVRSGRA